MSLRHAGSQENCNTCNNYESCEKHICDYCGTCEGRMNSFPECDFDLCADCFIVLSASLAKGLKEIKQDYILDEECIVKEKVFITRKTITESQREEIFIRDKYKCVHCGNNERLRIDHIQPFSCGGSTKSDNLQTLCESCNAKKGNKFTG
jgi:5-methylcytosine-specific restriction endonuclease McrA